ncbi:MAG: hypothetical protein JWP89_4887 [Schlesneria sp.]|nr:hypothetical protein [Schlesneria sp.]
MQGIVDISACNWIVVRILQFLPHHFVVLDLFGMASFLPDLIRALRLVPRLELTEHDIGASLLQQIDDLARRIAFDALQDIGKFWSARNQV